MKAEELRPCPICGAAPKIMDLAGWEIACSCGVVLALNDIDDDADNKDAIIKLWNNRPTEQQARRDALQLALMAVTDERLVEGLDNESDVGYNSGIMHCEQAVRALIEREGGHAS